MKQITYKRMSNIIVAFLLLCCFVVLVMTFSCTSKSGHMTAQPLEKVVIIDSYLLNKDGVSTRYKYKVKRIEHGVVDIIYDYSLFEVGDTLYRRFK